ncbi:DUF6141 family protein [Haloarcula amylovorans]|uniref:DUF6141 family protein n=1 Tax=Haloarcula amylovorans TaxID=2562280 RepID=UPI001076A8AF|nr:DUF6141 family protein [Halomicroarcula amylolytica]
MSQTIPFREVQRFRQWWLWLLLGIVSLVSFVSGGPVGIVIAGSIVVFLWSLRLITEVRDDGLYIRFVPIHRSFRRVPWTDIESVESVSYRPLREYGGWGIRWRSGAIAYNVSGSNGVFLTKRDDRGLLIGSQRADELAAAIQRTRNKTTP